ncbi:MAG: Glycine betaine/proline/ectoine/pipecolic acid transporter OusA [Chlamydiae bacterium]|nr:Glycine betaine/proline/ectoine/pipecolic acid transporter OusA [Chlamydiota bacterium]
MEEYFNKKLFYATILGNVVEHFDKVLFALIAPFIAPLFFPNSDPIVSLILIYLPFGFISRPLGALYWGYVGDRLGRKKALYLSILGMSLTLFCVGLLPTYQSIGPLSALFLHLSRAMICFFAAGEGPGASLILIENAPKQHKDLMSSYYEMSSMLGTLLASFVITILCFQGKVEVFWRLLFIFSGSLGLVTFWMRRDLFLSNNAEVTKPYQRQEPLIKQIKSNALKFVVITLVAGFSCANYRILSNLMNGYLPLVTSLSAAEMMGTHCILILYDFMLLPVFGWISKKIGKEKLITLALTSAAICVFPLFKILKHPTIINVLGLRMILVTWGIALAAPFNYWAISLISERYRFRVLSLSRAFGAQLIGGFAISTSLLIYKKSGWIFAPACYIFASAVMALGGLFVLTKVSRSVTEKKTQTSFL